jgi:hypothetical protein
MTDREHYLRHVIGPLVDELRASYELTRNPDVHARMAEAINMYELEMAGLEAERSDQRQSRCGPSAVRGIDQEQSSLVERHRP